MQLVSEMYAKYHIFYTNPLTIHGFKYFLKMEPHLNNVLNIGFYNLSKIREIYGSVKKKLQTHQPHAQI